MSEDSGSFASRNNWNNPEDILNLKDFKWYMLYIKTNLLKFTYIAVYLGLICNKTQKRLYADERK